jgi:hypothetical protein
VAQSNIAARISAFDATCVIRTVSPGEFALFEIVGIPGR